MQYPNTNDKVKDAASCIKNYCKKNDCNKDCVFYRGERLVIGDKMQYMEYRCAFGETPNLWKL
jgi:hypothetical protein